MFHGSFCIRPVELDTMLGQLTRCLVRTNLSRLNIEKADVLSARLGVADRFGHSSDIQVSISHIRGSD